MQSMASHHHVNKLWKLAKERRRQGRNQKTRRTCKVLPMQWNQPFWGRQGLSSSWNNAVICVTFLFPARPKNLETLKWNTWVDGATQVAASPRRKRNYYAFAVKSATSSSGFADLCIGGVNETVCTGLPYANWVSWKIWEWNQLRWIKKRLCEWLYW